MKVLHAATKTPCGQINEYIFSKKTGTITKKKKKVGVWEEEALWIAEGRLQYLRCPLKPGNIARCSLSTRWRQAPRCLTAQHMFLDFLHRIDAQGSQSQNLQDPQQQHKRVPLGWALVPPQVLKGSCPICFSVPEIPPTGVGMTLLHCNPPALPPQPTEERPG